MKTLSHDQIVRLRIIKALGVTEERMFWLEWNAGMRYLENQCMGHQMSIDTLKSDAFYWRWFMQQWYAANEMFVMNVTTAPPTWGMYIGFHKSFLGGENMCKSYMHYIGEITRKESRKVAKQYNPKVLAK